MKKKTTKVKPTRCIPWLHSRDATVTTSWRLRISIEPQSLPKLIPQSEPSAATREAFASWRWVNGLQRNERSERHYIRLIAHNLGTPAGMRGDFGEALRWLSRMLRKDGQTDPAAPMPQEAVAHLNIARCYLYRGDFASSEMHLDSALERCQLFNLVA